MTDASSGKHHSYWIDTTPRTDYPALPGVYGGILGAFYRLRFIG
jgi:hypothetical protein